MLSFRSRRVKQPGAKPKHNPNSQTSPQKPSQSNQTESKYGPLDLSDPSDSEEELVKINRNSSKRHTADNGVPISSGGWQIVSTTTSEEKDSSNRGPRNQPSLPSSVGLSDQRH